MLLRAILNYFNLLTLVAFLCFLGSIGIPASDAWFIRLLAECSCKMHNILNTLRVSRRSTVHTLRLINEKWGFHMDKKSI